MTCPNCRRLCDRLVISDAVTFEDDTLVINIPQDNYGNNEKYCLVVAQNLPDTATISAPVVITIGAAATTYPLLYSNCTPVYASNIFTRTRYSMKVRTNVEGGAFVIFKKIPCEACYNQPASLPIAATDGGGTDA